MPHISRHPTRVGLVETVRLFTSEFSMNTDYLLMLSGILADNGGVIAQIEERYTITATCRLGRDRLDSSALPSLTASDQWPKVPHSW